jgi:hypothetical protein
LVWADTEEEASNREALVLHEDTVIDEYVNEDAEVEQMLPVVK